MEPFQSLVGRRSHALPPPQHQLSSQVGDLFLEKFKNLHTRSTPRNRAVSATALLASSDILKFPKKQSLRSTFSNTFRCRLVSSPKCCKKNLYRVCSMWGSSTCPYYFVLFPTLCFQALSKKRAKTYIMLHHGSSSSNRAGVNKQSSKNT